MAGKNQTSCKHDGKNPGKKRVFTEEEEIKILEYVLELRNSTKGLPSVVEVTSYALNRLRNDTKKTINRPCVRYIIKFMRQFYKNKVENNEPVQTLHEKKICEISEQIWKLGPVRDGNLEYQSSFINNNAVKKYPSLMNELSIWRGSQVYTQGLLSLDSSYLKELDKKWFLLKSEEIDIFLKRIELIEQMLGLITEASEIRSLDSSSSDSA